MVWGLGVMACMKWSCPAVCVSKGVQGALLLLPPHGLQGRVNVELHTASVLGGKGVGTGASWRMDGLHGPDVPQSQVHAGRLDWPQQLACQCRLLVHLDADFLHLWTSKPKSRVAFRRLHADHTLMSRMRWKSVGVPEGSRVEKLGTKCSGLLPTTFSSASHLHYTSSCLNLLFGICLLHIFWCSHTCSLTPYRCHAPCHCSGQLAIKFSELACLSRIPLQKA